MAKNVTISGEQVTLTGTGKGKVNTADQNNIDLLDSMLFDAYGVEGMGEYFLNRIDKGDSISRIIYDIRYGKDKTPEGSTVRKNYLDVFKDMDTFLAEGGAFYQSDRPERDYIAYRKSVQDTLKEFRLDVNTLGSRDKIAQYIKNNANPAVIVQRIMLAKNAVDTLPQDVKDTFSKYYNLGTQDLLTYYLDTTKNTEEQLKAKQTAAQMIVQYEPLTTGAPGVETVSLSDIEKAAGGEKAAVQNIQRVAGSRVAKFEQGGGFAESQRGISGLTSTSS